MSALESGPSDPVHFPPYEELFATKEFDRLGKVRDILTNEYPHTRDAIILLEKVSRKKSTRAKYELRDALTHLSCALLPHTSPAEARHHLDECRTHLRRASVETFEWVAERRVYRIERKALRGRWFYFLLFLGHEDLVPRGMDLISDLREIGRLIVAGRIAKSSAEGIQLMQQAEQKARAFAELVEPKIRQDRIFTFALFVVSLLASAIAVFA